MWSNQVVSGYVIVKQMGNKAVHSVPPEFSICVWKRKFFNLLLPAWEKRSFSVSSIQDHIYHLGLFSSNAVTELWVGRMLVVEFHLKKMDLTVLMDEF